MTSQQPYLRVAAGDPTDEELAALVSVLAARAGAAHRARTTGAAGLGSSSGSGTSNGLSAWGSYWHRLREPAGPRAGGWRASALPL